MLLEIRERAQGWVAWAIVILISIPFALWGIQSYLGVGAEAVVATVNGQDITDRQLTQSLQRTRMEMRERLGDAYDPALFEGADLRNRVLDQLIEQRLLLDAANRLGLRVADAALRAAILQEPAFQADGRFDKTAYERILQYQGMTPLSFEENLRLQLLETQLERALLGTAFATSNEVDESIRLIRQQREISFIQLPKDRFTPDAPPSEAELRAFYDKHPDAFQSVEQVKVSYLLLSTEALGAAQQITESDLQALYEERAETLKTPERREIRHILIAVPVDAEEAVIKDAQGKAESIRARLLAGEDFAGLARELSDDPVSAEQGGSLGAVERGMFDPALEQVAFDLPVGELSEPVRSRFGYHLIEVTDIEPAALPAYEDVEDDLRAALQNRSAEGVFYDYAERLATLTYEVPDSLVPAAEDLGLEIKTTEWLDRSGGEGLFANPKVVNAAFSDEVLVMGNNSELIEPDPQRLEALVLRVEEHRPAAVRPFDEVRAEIADRLKSEQAATAALEAAEHLAEGVEQGKALSAVAGDDYPVEALGFIERQSGAAPAAVIREAFSLPRPASGALSVGTASSPSGDAFVVQLSDVRDGQPSDMNEQTRAMEARVLAQSVGRSNFSQFVAGLEEGAKIERKPLESDEIQ